MQHDQTGTPDQCGKATAESDPTHPPSPVQAGGLRPSVDLQRLQRLCWALSRHFSWTVEG